MAEANFTRREVERAFRKFKDLYSDLIQAKFQTWADAFTHFVTHCEKNPVMRVVTEPLRNNRNVDAKEWYAKARSSKTGSGNYKLPVDDDDRTALLYQFFLYVEYDNIDITDFCIAVYGTGGYQDMVYHFNNELITKFAREVSYRLDEIIEDIGEAQEVSAEAMHVFHYHAGAIMKIEGGIHGSNVAIGGSTVSRSTATYNTNADLADALKALKPLVHELAESQRAVVETALGALVSSAENGTALTGDAATAAAVVANASPSLKARLTEIAGKIGLSLVSSFIFLAIKSAVKMH